MKSFVLILFLCIVLIFNAYTQPATIVPAACSAGGASCAMYGEWKVFHNPALLATQDKISLAALYANRFGVKELSTQCLSASLPTSFIHVGAAYSHFGFSCYSEQLIGLAFAKTFDKLFTLGVQFNYYASTISNSVGQKGMLLAQIGLLAEVSSGFYMGFNTFNPTQQKLKYQEVEKDIPSLFSLGASYRFADDFHWLMQLDKELSSDLIWRTGFEYQPLDFFRIRLGTYGSPFTPSLGCGFRWNSLAFDANFERHPVLGITSIGALRYDF